MTITMLESEPERAVYIVEKWSRENPIETYKTYFLKRFPKADVGVCCRDNIYGTVNQSCEDAGGSDCVECWNEPMSEE